MKKIYILLLFVGLVGMVNAQRAVTGTLPVSKNFNLNLDKEFVVDTLQPAGWVMDSISLYTTTDANGNFAGFVCGINTYADVAKVQEYNAGATGYQVMGGLMMFGYKGDLDTIATNNGGFSFSLYSFNNDTPSTVTASKALTYEQIDTLNFTIAMFDNPVAVTNQYGVGLDLSASFTATSILTLYGLYSSAIGMGGAANLAWEQWSDGAWYQMNPAWQGFDADLAIFPIVQTEIIGIEELSFINGMKVNCYPNPATEVLNINYVLENAANVEISLININGQVVRNLKAGNLNAGNHVAEFQVTDLSTGNYFVAIQAGTNKLAQRISIK